MKKLTEKQIINILNGSLIPPQIAKLLEDKLGYKTDSSYPDYYIAQKLIRDFCDIHIAINPIIARNHIMWDYDIYRISTATNLPDIASRRAFDSWELAFEEAATKILTEFKKQKL